VVAVFTHEFSAERAAFYHSKNRRPSFSASREREREEHREREKEKFLRGEKREESDSSLSSSLSSLRVQSLVLVGDQDILITPDNSLYLSHLLKCQCLMVKESGHMMYLEHPSLYADLLHEHFTQTSQKQLSHFSDSKLVTVVNYDDNLYTIKAAKEAAEKKREKDSSSSPSSSLSWRSLLTFFFIFKLFQSTPLWKALCSTSFGSLFEAAKPLSLLLWHLKTLLLSRFQELLSLVRRFSSIA